MTLHRARIAVFLLLAALSSLARSQVASIDGVALSLSPPPGLCAIGEKADPFGLVPLLRASTGSDFRILMVFADCNDLQKAQQGAQVSAHRYGTYSVRMSGARPLLIPASVSRADAICQLRGASEQIDPQEASRRVEAVGNARLAKHGIQVGGISLAGVLNTDENAFYLGAYGVAQDGTGRSKNVLVVQAISNVKHLVFLMNSFEVYGGRPDFTGLLASSKSAMARVVTQNP